jgi:peptide/nickel transport system substrate-binding protein
VRQAVNVALDREGMNQAVLLGRGEPAIATIPAALPFHDAGLQVPEQNIEMASELLKEAEAEGVSNPSFTMIVPNEDDFWLPASQIVQQNLSEAGFEVKLQKEDTSTWLELAETGKYEASFGAGFAEMPSPAELFAFYNGYNGFFTNAPTEETSKVFSEALAAVNTKKREALYDQLQEIIADEGYVVNVLYKPYSWAFRSNVSGFYVGISSIPYFAETSLGS